MPNAKTILWMGLVMTACQEEEKNIEEEDEEFVDCPTILLPCPEGQIPCDAETDSDECTEVVLGEEPCTQMRYCTPE